MSVLVTLKVTGDSDRFREFVSANPDKLKAIGDEAQGRGAIHHRFGVGDGYVLVIDEWESAEQFQGFFQGNPQIGEVMQAAGAQGEPEIAFGEAIETADQF
jgi:hypothetical protein